MNRLCMAGLLFFSAALAAQTPPPEHEREEDLVRIRSRIATLEKMLAESRRNVATLSEELKRLDWKLEIAEQQGKLLGARRRELSEQLAETQVRREAAAEASARFARALFARARVLYRFGRFGYFRVLLEARDVPGLLQGLDRLDALARRDGRLLRSYRDAQTLLEADLARETTLKGEIDQLWARSRRELSVIAALRGDRETLLDREKSASASRRDEVVALTDKAARLERLLETLSRQSTGEPVDASGGIRPWKGVLDWPARGTLVETFGRHRHPKFSAWTFSNGIALALPAGTPVRAVYSGKAAYAQWLAEYGNLVILDHGDGVFTLYAWLQSVSVIPGSYVPVGGTIGTAGTGPGHEEPGVYFEVRDRQKATDPVAWLR